MVSQQGGFRGAGLACGLAALLSMTAVVTEGQQKLDSLRIGSSAAMAPGKAGKEKAAFESLQAFIKEETKLENTIVSQKGWKELADRMARGELHLGVFQGYEYAWAKEKYPELKALALAVNVHRYPVAYVLTQAKGKAQDFADLKGQTLAIPSGGQRYLRLFVEHKIGGKTGDFFSKVSEPDDIEEALDDVVDGKVQAAVVDRAALEAFERRKPARFKQLKELARSQPLPPPVVAYHGDVLAKGRRERFRAGLLTANQKAKGQQMLTLFRLTGFESVPNDFDKVLAESRKTYPAPEAKAN